MYVGFENSPRAENDTFGHKLPPGEADSFVGQDPTPQRLGSIAVPATSELISSIEAAPPFVVPSHEETRAIYDQVAHERELPIPEGMDLGKMLSRLPPDRQNVFRALHGMFPFDRRYEAGELATLRGVDKSAIYSISSRTIIALKKGTGAYQKDNPRTAVSLEDLAREILKNTHNLQPHELDLLQQISGLPPYLLPLGPSEIAEGLGVSRSAVTLREKTAAQKLLGVIPAAAHPLRIPLPASVEQAGSDTQPAPSKSKMRQPEQAPPSSVVDAEQRSRLLRTRDAGWYAGMLHSLHAAESRDYWADVIRHDLGRAALLRGHMRKRRARHPKPLNTVLQSGVGPGASAAADELLDTRRAFSQTYDTTEGQEQIVQDLIVQAEKFDKSDLADLERVMEEGVQAQRQLTEDNIALVFFTALRMGTNNGDKRKWAANKFDMAAGYKGLREAVQRFDESLGFTFSTYATKMISGHILKARIKEAAAKRGVGRPTYLGLVKIKRAEHDLFQQLRRQPTNEEIAQEAKLSGPEEVERLRMIALRSAALSMDKPNKYGTIGGLGTLHETVGHLDPGIERILSADELTDTFQGVFRESGLNAMEQKVLKSMFGIASEEISEADLAQDLGITEAEVKKLFRSGKKKIATSPGARKLLRGYVEQIA